jgi:NhaP-type Na+/H+ or K+/H+ antiporter
LVTPGIRILLARHALFSFVISIIPALMPVVGLKQLHLQASELGYLFTSMAAGSVLAGVRLAFDPELFLVLFVSPLLSVDGWRVPKRECAQLRGPILTLALGLVLWC